MLMSCQDENALQASSPPEGAIYPTAIWPANTNLSFPRNFVFQEMGSKAPRETGGEMQLKIPKQEYTGEFKELTVKRVKAGAG